MQQPGRTYNSSSYRYGFQNQEKDDEVKGSGNSINYKYRMHDPRLGRFFSVDPLTRDYPWYTPYSFSGNKVIAFRELEGLEETVAVIENQGITILKLSDYTSVSDFKKAVSTWVHFAYFNTDASWSHGESQFRSGVFESVAGGSINDHEVKGSLTVDVSGTTGRAGIYFEGGERTQETKKVGFIEQLSKNNATIDKVWNDPTNSSVQATKKTINNYFSTVSVFAGGGALQGASLLSKGIGTLGIINDIDDLSSNSTSNGGTLIQNSLGDKTGNFVKASIGLLGTTSLSDVSIKPVVSTISTISGVKSLGEGASGVIDND